MRKAIVWFALVCALAESAAERPATWAVKMKRAGLPNLHKVDAKLYRASSVRRRRNWCNKGLRLKSAQKVPRIGSL